MDDICIHTKTLEDHRRVLVKVFNRLRMSKLMQSSIYFTNSIGYYTLLQLLNILLQCFVNLLINDSSFLDTVSFHILSSIIADL